MIYYVAFVTLVFLSRFHRGINRMNDKPKSVLYYNHKSDMVEMILNMIVGVVGLCFLIDATSMLH